MADNATCSFGTKFSYGTYTAATPETPPGSYTEFGQLIDADIPKITTMKIKATRLNQSDPYKRKRPGFNDAEDITLHIHYEKADYETLKGFADNRSEKWFKIEIPEADDSTHYSRCQFHGFISGLGMPVPDSDSESGFIIEATFTVNGKPQFDKYA